MTTNATTNNPFKWGGGTSSKTIMVSLNKPQSRTILEWYDGSLGWPKSIQSFKSSASSYAFYTWEIKFFAGSLCM